jgi:hypothetical protein
MVAVEKYPGQDEWSQVSERMAAGAVVEPPHGMRSVIDCFSAALVLPVYPQRKSREGDSAAYTSRVACMRERRRN